MAPGRAHPFIGLNEALVHNGDFANYHSVTEYLAGRNIFPQFLTDTEVSVQLFDLWSRVYRYPTEYIIEALAPTTELDFDRLPPEKQRVYRQIQASHIHASPDGPWFFIIARSLTKTNEFQLVGITDTAMLRPQVFALQEGEVSIGLVCSEKQAIDATLASLASEDPRFTPQADYYWNARGGSSTDGGAFLMTVSPCGPGRQHQPETTPAKASPSPIQEGSGRTPMLPRHTLRVTNKFGEPVATLPDQVHCNLSPPLVAPAKTDEDAAAIEQAMREDDSEGLFTYLRDRIATVDYDRLRWLIKEIASRTSRTMPALGIETLTRAIDRRYPTGSKKRSSVLTILRGGLERIFQCQPVCGETSGGSHLRITWAARGKLRGPNRAKPRCWSMPAAFRPKVRTATPG